MLSNFDYNSIQYLTKRATTVVAVSILVVAMAVVIH